MKKNRFGLAATVLSAVAITSLSVSYARQLPGTPPSVPDHAMITGPIPLSDVGLFRDASTLWLTDVLIAQGAQAKGKKAKFNETTIIHKSVLIDYFQESVLRHKEWSGRIVGGPVSEVKPLTSEQYVALHVLFDAALKKELKGEVMADENGIRGRMSSTELGMSQTEIRNKVRDQQRRLRMYLLQPGGGGG